MKSKIVNLVSALALISCGSPSDGKDGKPGPKGSTGAPGVDGVNGKDGVNGADGVNGKDGLRGKPGIDGTNGVNGKDSVSTETTVVVKEVVTEKEVIVEQETIIEKEVEKVVVVDGKPAEKAAAVCKATFPGLKGLFIEHFVLTSGDELFQVAVKDITISSAIVSKEALEAGETLSSHSSVYGIDAKDLWSSHYTEGKLYITHYLDSADKTFAAAEKLLDEDTAVWVKKLLDQPEKTWELPCE